MSMLSDELHPEHELRPTSLASKTETMQTTITERPFLLKHLTRLRIGQA